MKLKTASIALLCSLFASVTAYAAERPVIFEDLDTNADGCISKKEAMVRKDLMENFADIDEDKNGTLCVDEYTAYENRGRLVPEEVEIPEPGAAPIMR